MPSLRAHSAVSPAALLIRAGRVHVAFPGPVYSPGAVLIRDGRIVWAGPDDDRPPQTAPRSITIAEIPDAVILPGFIDAHVHLAFDAAGTPAESVSDATPAQVLERMRAGARELLAAGVTTARDLGSPACPGELTRSGGGASLGMVLRAELAAGASPGPRLLASGAPLTPPGGHLHFLGCAVGDAQAARRAVHAQAAAGADWIKLVLSGGETTPGSRLRDPGLSRAQLRAAVRAARHGGLPVAVHAHTVAAARAAIRAGADTIEHCTLLGARAGYAASIPRRGSARRRLVVSPTANSRWLTAPPGQRRGRSRRLAALLRAGAELIAGTDAGIPGVFPGAYADGLIALVRHGVPPETVLRAATTGAAQALRLFDRGALLPGYAADLIALAADPLDDIGAVTQVTGVWQGRH
jgi:imidazolonepropionase-like amidohydrolase